MAAPDHLVRATPPPRRPAISATEQAAVAVSMTSVVRRSLDSVELLEFGPRAAVEDGGGVAMAEGRDEVGLHIGLVRRRTPRRPWRCRSPTSARIETERARGDDEIGALQRRVAKGVRVADVGIGEPILGGRRVREEPGQVLGKSKSIATITAAGATRILAALVPLESAASLSLALLAQQPDEARGLLVGRGRPQLH